MKLIWNESIPALVRHLSEDTRVADSEVVDQNVRRAAERVEDVRDGVCDAGGCRQVGGDHAAPHRSALRERDGILVGDDDRGPFRGKQVGSGLPNSVRAGADERELSRELVVHVAIDEPMSEGTLSSSQRNRLSVAHACPIR